MTNLAKTLLIDIETSPIKALTWETYQTNVLKVLEPSKIISVAWKFLGDAGVSVRAICDYKDYRKGIVNDRSLVSEVWSLLDTADIVIGHHAAAFDIKKLNARFIINGLEAPSHYEVVDTLKAAKKYFKFDSNSLAALGGYLDEGDKLPTGGFDLWVRCMNGDPVAWKQMKAYNVGDVELLERVYMRLRKYMNGDHPDVNLVRGILGSLACHICGSSEVQRRGYSYTKTGRKQRYQCSSGHWSTGPYERVKKSNDETPAEEEF